MDRIVLNNYLPDDIHPVDYPKHISANDTSIVIPVKNNQAGVERFLEQLFSVTAKEYFPKEIIIVDNNSDPEIHLDNDFPRPVRVIRCQTPGPAAARNCGYRSAEGKWIWFTDSDCLPTSSSISGYLGNAIAGAFAGNITITTDNLVSSFYKKRGTFQIKPSSHPTRIGKPAYVVTANCFIAKSVLEAIDGFDEYFPLAGGEDKDLGLRLLKVSEIEYNHHSITEHEMNDGLKGFINRYSRYGFGNRMLAEKYQDFLEDTDYVRPAIIKHFPILLTPVYSLLFFTHAVAYMHGYWIKYAQFLRQKESA